MARQGKAGLGKAGAAQRGWAWRGRARRGRDVLITGEQMHNTDDHEADALPQAQGKGEPIKELTLSAFLDANASDSIEGFESMDPLADPQPARFYRPAMGKVLIHTEKRGPAFEPKCQRCGGNGTLCLAPGGDPSNAHDVPCLMCVVLPEDQDEAEARAEAEYRLAFHDGILSFIVQGVR